MRDKTRYGAKRMCRSCGKYHGSTLCRKRDLNRFNKVDMDEKKYTKLDLERAYCLGFVNRELSLDELSEESKELRTKFNLVVAYIDSLKP